MWTLTYTHNHSFGKESACNAEDPGSIPGSARSPGEENDNPTPVFLPGEFHGQRSLESYSSWGHKEATAGFSKFAGILSAALSQHHLLEFGIAQLEFHH